MERFFLLVSKLVDDPNQTGEQESAVNLAIDIRNFVGLLPLAPIFLYNRQDHCYSVHCFIEFRRRRRPDIEQFTKFLVKVYAQISETPLSLKVFPL